MPSASHGRDGAAQLIAEARANARSKAVITDLREIEPWLTDWRGRVHGAAPAILAPATTEEVADIVRLAAKHRVPLVPQGGNTGMAAGATPPADGTALLLSMRRMNGSARSAPRTVSRSPKPASCSRRCTRQRTKPECAFR